MLSPLPIDDVLPQLLQVLKTSPNAVLEAPPGAGKTTRVPPALLPLVTGEIVVLEPRRIAARMAARRVAEELGERVGETVGYQVRFEDVARSTYPAAVRHRGSPDTPPAIRPESQGSLGAFVWTNFMNGISKPTWRSRYCAASNRPRALI